MENINVKNSLGEIISNSKLKQLRIAETEKYAHVTYFFNGGLEDCFEGEDRVLVPSPRVETYDQKPEMAANEVTEELNKRINKNEYSLIVTNFANTDMVGHTGNLEATIKAAETLDSCLGKIYEECKKNNYILVVTSDHGNADNMFDSNKNLPCTTHSLNPVPFIICSREKDIRMSKGKLCDIAPTILKLLDIEIPREMDGEVLKNEDSSTLFYDCSHIFF
jgi:2,3-bisphosphoglycerate-independent phosphoglycerate mutase